MPGRNGGGPMGAGPRTGRGMGFCQGYTEIRGGRRGCGLGRGFGFGNGYSRGDGRGGIQPVGRNSDVANLKEYQNYLEDELRQIKVKLGENK
ncbi:hypothetical protein ASZ90_018704 [hydrocarbon metagenome]|uniref:Uncharacterized protein n=1 Tax=hydrocarbon metagenome TaxID=938273 RepID=A0A0W8E5K6_9ZZZZ